MCIYIYNYIYTYIYIYTHTYHPLLLFDAVSLWSLWPPKGPAPKWCLGAAPRTWGFPTLVSPVGQSCLKVPGQEVSSPELPKLQEKWPCSNSEDIFETTRTRTMKGRNLNFEFWEWFVAPSSFGVLCESTVECRILLNSALDLGNWQYCVFFG